MSNSANHHRLSREDAWSLVGDVAAKAQSVVQAFEKRRTLKPASEELFCRGVAVDPDSFDCDILRALDSIEELINPSRHLFGSKQRDMRFQNIIDPCSGRTKTCSEIGTLFLLHDRILEVLGVEKEISTRRVPAESSWPYESFLWYHDLNFELGSPDSRLLRKLSAAANEFLGDDIISSSAIRPRWDKETRKLWFGDQVSKEYRQAAKNQESILGAFEDENWPAHIDDPITGDADLKTDKAQRLGDAVRGLNNNNTFLHFERDGTGQGVNWKPK